MKKRATKIGISLVVIIAGIFGFFGVRQAIAKSEVERELRSIHYPKLHNLGTTRTLAILPLFDFAAGKEGAIKGKGVSYLVKTDHATILLDVGFNAEKSSPSPLEHNMHLLEVDDQDVDTILITHNHPDHTGGIKWWLANTFSMGNQQASLQGKTILVPEPMSYPGLTPQVASTPKKLADGVATMGTIPFQDVFPISLLTPKRGEETLAVNVEGIGVVLISGCGHPGLKNILSRAEMIFDSPIAGFVGGLHLGSKTAQDLQAEITLLQARSPKIVGLSPHDSGPAAVQAFQQTFSGVYQDIAVGKEIRLEK
jgi:7,8-dihydropterin-6-yl-methyl-4-(beta-D-ribofuranosyl)aminobenzene 5'-phosphate synthase